MKRKRGDDGASAVELALVLPLLLLIVFGVIQFGYMFFAWNSMATAAGQAARYMAIHNDQSGARALAREVLPGADDLGIQDADITFSFSSGTACAADRTVTVTIVHTSPIDLLPFVDNSITRRSAAECVG